MTPVPKNDWLAGLSLFMKENSERKLFQIPVMETVHPEPAQHSPGTERNFHNRRRYVKGT